MNAYEATYTLMGEIWENFSEEDKKWFLNTPAAEMHLDLGMHLRNHAHLWSYEWEPLIENGVDISVNHPDALSNKVIRDFQKVKRDITKGYWK